MKISRRQFLAGMFFSGAGFVSTDSLFFERYFVETNEFKIGAPSNGNAVLRILQISDLHLKRLTVHHRRLADQVNGLSPDFLLFTGDIIESEKGLHYLDGLLKMLDRDVQKAAIMGNWEWMFNVDVDKLRDVYRDNNGELLINRSQAFTIHGERLMVTGVDSQVKGFPDFAEAVRGVGREKHHIVLSHCPEYRDSIEREITRLNMERDSDQKLNIEYVFSGHSHGGQVAFLGYAPLLPPGVGRYVRGWFRERSPMLYVSKGIGTSVLPVRFGARAEITLFKYHTV